MLLHLKQLSKPISSDLLTYLLYLLDSLSLSLCVRARAVPIIMVFVHGVGYGFLSVYNVMRELFESTCLNIVIIVTCFVASVMLSFLINDFIILYIAIVKRVVPVVVNALYKSPLLLLFFFKLPAN